MYKIFTLLKAWLVRMTETDCPADPLEEMTPRERADLPVNHPLIDRDCAC